MGRRAAAPAAPDESQAVMLPPDAEVKMGAGAAGGGGGGGSPDRLMRDHPQGVILTVMVTPRAVRSEVAGPHGTYLRVRIAAPAVDGRANQAAVRLLSRTFGCRVDMLSGARSRIKRMLLRGVEPAAVAAVLQGRR